MKRTAAEPYWNNGWFGTLDAAALMFLLADRKPKTYVEGGSGFLNGSIRREALNVPITFRLTWIERPPRP